MTVTIPTWVLLFIFGPVALLLLASAFVGALCIYYALRGQFNTR